MYKIPEQCTKVRIDVGLSNTGPISQWWLENLPDVFVIGVEPNPESVANCKCFNTLLLDRFFLEEIAISNVDGVMWFYMTEGDPGCSSLYKPIAMGIKQAINIQVRHLDYIFNKLPEGQIIELLKTDTQGNDYIIHESLKHRLNQIVFIDCELGTNGQYEVVERNIFDLMISNNFKLLEVTNGNGRFYNTMFEEDIKAGKYNNKTIPFFA